MNLTEHPVLATEPPWNSPANRERMAEIFFEEHQVPAFYIANTGVLNSCALLLVAIPIIDNVSASLQERAPLSWLTSAARWRASRPSSMGSFCEKVRFLSQAPVIQLIFVSQA